MLNNRFAVPTAALPEDFTHVTLDGFKPAKVQFSKLGNGQVYVNCEPIQGRDLVCFRAESRKQLRKNIESDSRYDAVFSNISAPDANAEDLKNLAALREQAHIATAQEKIEARHRLERAAGKGLITTASSDEDIRQVARAEGIRDSVLDALNNEGNQVLEQVTITEMNRLAGNMTDQQRRQKMLEILESLVQLPHWQAFTNKHNNFLTYGRVKDSAQNFEIFCDACKTMGWTIPTRENADLLLRNLVENGNLYMSNGYTRSQVEILGHGRVRRFTGMVTKAARIPDEHVNDCVRRLKQAYGIPLRPTLDQLRQIGCTDPDAMMEALELRFGRNNRAAEAQQVNTKSAAELHQDLIDARIARDSTLTTAEKMRRENRR